MPLRSKSVEADEAAINQQASDWVARRDRGLTPAEQDAYLQWLHDDPRKQESITRYERVLRGIMQLSEHKPQDLRLPDLDSSASRSRRRLFQTVGVAIAASIAIAFIVGRSREHRDLAVTSGANQSELAQDPYLRVNERRVLADGSEVELRENSSIVVEYSPAERRVRLISGEAIFTAAKDPNRPFVVESSGVGIVAIGTVFDVRQSGPRIDVVVAQGKVRIQESLPAANFGAGDNHPWPTVSAGQRATMTGLETAGPTAQVSELDAAQISNALAWRTPRLQFAETSLVDALAEFNRYGSRRITLGDPTLASVRVGGSFRSDNVDGFLHSLHSILGLVAEERAGGEIILRRSP